jgi:uncharacterized phage-associated protein
MMVDIMIAARKKAPIQKMEPHLDKIVEAILLVIREAVSRRKDVTTYDIVKSLFLADRAHLNKFGRPITFDNYVAMVHGPVPSTAYNILKNHRSTLQRVNGDIPWASRPAPEIGQNAIAFINPARDVKDDVLTESDVEELKAALTVVQSLGFNQIRRLTHEDQAYLDAWEDDGERAQYPMSYSLLFDTPNLGEAVDLSFLSKHS